MRNVIQLKQAKAVEEGEHILTPQFGMGILLAFKVVKNESIDEGKRVEIETAKTTGVNGKRLHVVEADQLVAVVI